jgi:hypothetical protein
MHTLISIRPAYNEHSQSLPCPRASFPCTDQPISRFPALTHAGRRIANAKRKTQNPIPKTHIPRRTSETAYPKRTKEPTETRILVPRPTTNGTSQPAARASLRVITVLCSARESPISSPDRLHSRCLSLSFPSYDWQDGCTTTRHTETLLLNNTSYPLDAGPLVSLTIPLQANGTKSTILRYLSVIPAPSSITFEMMCVLRTMLYFGHQK